MKKIIGIGNALVDVMTMINDDTILKKFELPKGSMQLVDNVKSEIIKNETRSLNRILTSGGSVANTMHGLAMLGTDPGYIGSIGRDDIGDFFENDMKNAGVNTFMLRRESYTGTAIALITPDSERTFATHLGAAVELEAGDLKSSWFTGFDILYVEGYLIINKALVETACSLAKDKGLKVAIDLASYNVVDAKRDDFREIIEKYVDIVFANADEARSFTGLEPELALDEISKLCEIAIVKVGPEGSWIKRGEEKIKIDAAEAELKDTTGAGDLYASGFFYGLAQGDDLVKCGLYGSILAGHVIEIVGARMDETRWKKAINDVRKIQKT
jgi:sugar/nucleoside kinase (ribokinase family)